MQNIICNDSLKVLLEMESNSIDTLISDIPYGVNINKIWDKSLPPVIFWKECYRILKPGSFCIIFGQPSMNMNLMSIMCGTSFEYKDMWIWQSQGTHTKGTKVKEGNSIYRSRIRNVFNPIYVFRKKIIGTEKENWQNYRTNLLNIDVVREPYEGNHTAILNKFKSTGKKHVQAKIPSNTFKTMKRKGWIPDERGREPVNLKYFPRATKKERTIDGMVENNHETVKPISLMLWIVNLTTNNNNQIVIDPFCGSGSTGCACKLLDRKFIGIDIDPISAEVAKNRIASVENIQQLFKL